MTQDMGEAGEGWRDMASAPKDAWVLLYGRIDPATKFELVSWTEPAVFVGGWDQIDESWVPLGGTWEGPFMEVSHWRPLPPPPGQEPPPPRDAERAVVEARVIATDAVRMLGELDAYVTAALRRLCADVDDAEIRRRAEDAERDWFGAGTGVIWQERLVGLRRRLGPAPEAALARLTAGGPADAE